MHGRATEGAGPPVPEGEVETFPPPLFTELFCSGIEFRKWNRGFWWRPIQFVPNEEDASAYRQPLRHAQSHCRLEIQHRRRHYFWNWGLLPEEQEEQNVLNPNSGKEVPATGPPSQSLGSAGFVPPLDLHFVLIVSVDPVSPPPTSFCIRIVTGVRRLTTVWNGTHRRSISEWRTLLCPIYWNTCFYF